MGILNIGIQALQASQVALQTAGHNIANVNTQGYSRQRVLLETNGAQFTGGGYIGKGVNIQSIQRNFSAFLTRQATAAGATQSADTVRADKLQLLEGLFPGGASGLGASINDMLNAFSDVASAPTDLTARTVVLTRLDETASRMRAASLQLDDLQSGVTQELTQKATAINSLTRSIAAVNGQIARDNGSGQPPNDLLDQRDQLIRDLNQYIQTTSIAADDGTVGVFVGGSQALVLGNTASTVSIVSDDFGQPNAKLAINRNGVAITLNENTLGGGEVPGLLRFQNTDLVEGRNLLGRLTMAITDSVNTQHKLGIDLNGNPGGNLLTPITASSFKVAPSASPANAGAASLKLEISDSSQFAASDYELAFTTPTSGTITRRSDGVVISFPQVPATTLPILAVIDGISITQGGGAAVAGDRFLLKPFSTPAASITRQFSSPQALAVASPVAIKMGATNTGSLSLSSLVARDKLPANVPVTITFRTVPNTYTRSDDLVNTYQYSSGTAIESNLPINFPTTPYKYASLDNWSVTLQGSPKPGDTFKVFDIKDAINNNNADYKLNSGNATAMMNLRDVPIFDGAAMTDGYAGLIAQIGIRAQNASYATQVSTTIATNLEKDRAGVSGVNLDEEAAKLLQYQQAYQAAAKTIQIAQSIFDTLIQGLGR